MPAARYGRGPRVALGVAFAAAVVMIWSVWRAAVVEAVEPLRPAAADVSASASPSQAGDPRVDALAAVDKDPFHPERRRPSQRFRLPGERRSRPAPAQVGLPASMKLIGTMVYEAGRGTALLQEPGRPTRMLRVGEQLGDLRLEQVDREQAVFVTPTGSRVTIRVSKAGG